MNNISMPIDRRKNST